MDCPSAEARPWPRWVADLCDARGCLGSRSGLHNKPTAWMAWFGKPWFGKPYRAYQPWTRPVPDVLDLAAPNGRLQPALSTNWFDAVRLMETPRMEALSGLSYGGNPLAEYLQCLLTPFPPSLPSPISPKPNHANHPQNPQNPPHRTPPPQRPPSPIPHPRRATRCIPPPHRSTTNCTRTPV